MSAHRALAPAKVNLGLFVGPTRAGDARHELVSVMQSISLADELTLRDAPAGAEHDELICPGVPGPAEENLAAAALRAFRASTGWEGPPQRLSIVKRIPLAAGLAGGSADAAATLRLAARASGLGDERLLLELAAGLGADVPAQIAPGRWLASGAGERLRELPAPVAPFGVLVLSADDGLSTGAVYAESDRLGQTRTLAELERLHARALAALAGGAPLPAQRELLDNDLQRAALSLRPQLQQTLDLALGHGADVALLSGSGPTVLGLFEPSAERPEQGLERAQRAAAAIAGAAGAGTPAPLCAVPVDAEFARVIPAR